MILLVFLQFIVSAKGLDLFNCSQSFCPSYWLDDGYCDEVCMNSGCGFDYYMTVSSSPEIQFLYSDCYFNCMSSGCSYEMLGNGVCDSACNNYMCGWDVGECGYCADGCTKELLTNTACDSKCNNRNCMFDNNGCGWCAEGCFYDEMYDTTCQQECNTYDCNYDSNACTAYCSTGCPDYWIGDGYCDSVCYNSNCSYDNGDCDCSIGCTADVLNEIDCRKDSFGNIADPCATEKCKYKNGKCGSCNLDCFDSMLGDGACHTSCNVTSCNYDYGDCSCNPGCDTLYTNGVFDYKGECNLNCLVPQCNYNYGVCLDIFLIQSAILNQVINKNWTLTYSPSICNYNCNETMMRYYAEQTDTANYCQEDDGCNGLFCLHCSGHVTSTFSGCSLSNGTDCLVCSNMMLMDVCVTGITTCPLGYDDRIGLAGLLQVDKWCFLEPVQYSLNNYKIFYVNSSVVYDTGVYGTGTEDEPISDLYYALMSVFASFTKIILKPGNYDFQINKDASSPFITDVKDPLNTESTNTFTELWLIGEDEESPSNIYWQAGMKLTPKASKFYIKNLNFYGTKILRTCVQEYCLYCPIVQVIGTSYYDDRDVMIDSTTYTDSYGKSCDSYNEDVLFTFNKNAYIENTKFEGFRHQFYAFIYSTSNLVLKNVDFIKMQAVSGGGIIIQNCKSDCEDSNFYFVNGTVEDLGAGYEDTELVTTGSFFVGTNYNSSQFYNIDFKYNFVFSNIQASYSGNLIYSQNHIGGIFISNCNFENNYMNYGIYVDVTNLAYSDYKLVQGVSTAYSQTHFKITDTGFHHNYCSNNLISYFVKKTVHNIVMDNIVIDDIIVGGEVVSIDNSGKLKKADYEGQTIKVLIDNVSTKVIINPRKIVISNIIFDGVKVGQDVIYLSALPLVYVKSMIISSVSDGSKNNIKDIIVNFANSGRYLSNDPSDNEIPTLNCLTVTYFTNLYYFVLDEIEIYYTGCQTNSGPAGLYIDTVTSNITLTHIFIHDITEQSSSAIGLYISNVNLGTFDEMTFSMIVNYDDAIIEFVKVSNIIITNIHVSDVLSTFTGVILFTKVQILTMSNFDLQSSESEYGNGGCFLILSSTKGLNANIKIKDGSLLGCKATTGNGGGIFLDSGSTKVLNKISIKNVEISECVSNDGAMIYISSKVAFDQPSVIENITGIDNSATQGGTIGDYHNKGLLAIKNLYMQYNYGLHSGIYAFYILDEFLLSISDSEFIDNDSDESFFSFRSFEVGCSVKLENITLSNINAVAFEATKIDVYISNLTATNMLGFLTADSNANVITNNAILSGISSAAIYISKTSFLTCNNCIIENSQGTIITTLENSGIDFENCIFSNNKASATSIALFSDVNKNKENSFTNCIFENNSADFDALIYLSSTNLTISGCRFYKNLCLKGDYNGIYITGSNLKISDSDFEDQQALSTGGFLYSLNSEITIERSSFKKGVAYLAGGAFYLMTSDVFIEDCQFEENKAISYGGSIYMIESTVYIYNTQFVSGFSNYGDGIWSSTGTLLIEGGEFSLSQALIDSVAATLYSEEMENVILRKCNFKDPQSNVGGIFSSNDMYISIEDSSFENLIMNSYGAATFTGSRIFGSVSVKNSIFTNNNSTGNGAAIYIENYDFTMEDCTVSFNHANSSGGGLYLTTPLCLNCTFSIEGNTEIFNNSCGLEGGGIKWLDYKPKKGSNVKIYDNSATYGANFASKAIGLQLYNSRELKEIPIVDTIESIPPGQEYLETIKLYLYDSDGNVVTTDSTSQITLTGVSALENDTESAYSVSGVTAFTAEKGVFYITKFIPNGPPGSQMAIILTTGGISTTQAANDNNTYSDSAKILINLRECANGETIGSIGCIKCPAGKYLIKPADVCKSCPKGTTCYGGDVVVSNPGYWRSNLLSEIVYECQVYDSCIGGNETAYLGDCYTGYTSILCQTCTAGFSRSSSGKCNKCPNQTMNVVILLFFAIMMIGISVVLVKSTIKSAFTPSSMHSIYIKIFTNYLQLVFLTTQFNLNWPSYVMSLFSIQRSAATISEDLFSVDCYLDRGKTSSSTDSYFYKLVLLCAMPIIIAFISIAVWIVICLIKKRLSYLKREFFTTLIVLFFLVYPNIVKSMFTNFSCVDVDMKGSFLEQNTGISCWDKRHTQYSMIVALPGIIMWAIAAPALLLLRMYKRRRYFHKDNERVVFGFMYNGYKQSHFYWEFIIMYRKIIIITISVFMGNMSTIVQALTVVIIMLVSLYFQYAEKPYSHSELNHMEYEALFTASLTLYCGLFFLSYGVDESVKIILFIFIVFGNFYFIIYWIIFMFKAVVDLTAKIFPVLRAMLKKGDAYEEDFNTEELVRVGTYYDESEGARKCTFMHNDKEACLHIKLPKDVRDLFINAANNDDSSKCDDELDISRSQESQISDFSIENRHNLSRMDSSVDFVLGEQSFKGRYKVKVGETFENLENLETNRISTTRYDKTIGDLEDDYED